MSDSITDALQRWREGDENAQIDLEIKLRGLLLDLLRLVRRRVNAPLKARIDSQGVVNAAWNSFLTGIRKDEFPILASRANVRAILTDLVKRTLGDEIRWHTRQKRSPEREEPSEAGQPNHLPDADSMTPDLTAWLDNLEEVVCPVHEKAIEIVEGSLNGLSNNDLARQLGLTLGNVQRLKKKMHLRWQDTLGKEG
jgi:DNA-directed RNA polymerase specialized sigma24 family protein